MKFLSSLAERAVASRLARLRNGRLVIRDGAMRTSWGEGSQAPVEIVVHDRRFYGAVAFGGAVGAGEAYADGWWTTDDLTGVVRLLLKNRELLEGLETGWARLANPLRRIGHALNANSRRGSRRNIGAHYDLSNDFFRLILDESMTYSCGVFERRGASLADAQAAKYARIAALLDLRTEDRVVEIGTGWGGFAIHAAARYGCHVTTTTISQEQYDVAVARVASAGLTHRVTVLKQDYRDLRGEYDKLVSIEMIEAVGHEYFDTFFAKCGELIRPDGRGVIQAITIADERYEAARREVDFIKRHIFPGSCIPSRAVLRRSAAAADLSFVHVDEIGLHYAETLHRWHENMRSHRDQIAALGFDARFQRLWEFYFCYCEGGFLERAIGTAQVVLAKSSASVAAPLRVAAVPDMVAA